MVFTKKSVKMKKKGQVTFFIIIGIILLIIVGVYFALRGTIEEEPPILPEYQPIQQFIETCIDANAKEALFLLGQNSGHIYIPPELDNPLLFYRRTPIGTNEIPFWWYEGKEFAITESYVADQITRYMEDNIMDCLDFSSFQNKFSIEPILTKPQVNTILNEEDTAVEVGYPLQITKKSTGEVNTELRKFRVNIPIRMKKVLGLAEQIMQRELADKFVEEKTLDLITMSDERDIPYTGMEFKCGRKIWETRRVEQKLTERMRTNFDFIKIKGTNYNEDEIVDAIRDLKFKDSYYNLHYVWDLGEIEYPNTHVSFIFDENNDFDMTIKPNDGRYLKSNAEQATQMLSFFCFNIWHFTYDITYPVLVTIYDEQTDRNEEYIFKFAFQAAIEQNKPVRRSVLSQRYQGRRSADLEEYCRTDETDKEITISVVDSASREPVPEAELTLTCGNLACEIGSTEQNGELIDRLPYCVNAVLTATKEGYQETKTFIQTEVEGDSYVVEITPLIKLDNIEVVKHKLLNQRDSDGNLLPPGTEEDLADDEQAYIQITAEDYHGFTAYPSDRFGIIEDLDLEIPHIADRKYKVSIYLTKGELTESEESNLIGGFEGELQLSDYELQTLDKIKFHVFEFRAANEEENFLFVSGLESYSGKFPEMRPEVVVS